MSKHYITTTAQRGALPNHQFLKSLESITKEYDAEVIILPTNGIYHTSCKSEDEEILHPFLTDNYHVEDADYKINNNLDIKHFIVRAQQLNPLTSWDRHVASGKSAIMPSPKQFMTVVANSQTQKPKILMSTGAVTEPNYKEHTKWGYQAKCDHVYGAILTEVVNDDIFHFRQLKASKAGAFYDLGTRYEPNKKPRKERLEALVLGDIHHHQLCNKAWETTKELIAETRPKVLVMHDLFDGYSINHHDVNNIVTSTQKYGLSLEEELYNVGEFLDDTQKLLKGMKIVVVKSNHDEVIDRYLADGRFVKDPQNIDVALRLFEHQRNRENVLEKGVQMTYGRVKNVKWLGRTDDYKIRGNHLSDHGDKGPGASRGSLNNFEKSYGKGVRAHTHTPQMQRDVVTAGVMGNLNQGYNEGGPQGWMHSNVGLDKLGHLQIFNYINHRYKG
jgi:hypothetical protein